MLLILVLVYNNWFGTEKYYITTIANELFYLYNIKYYTYLHQNKELNTFIINLYLRDPNEILQIYIRSNINKWLPILPLKYTLKNIL